MYTIVFIMAFPVCLANESFFFNLLALCGGSIFGVVAPIENDGSSDKASVEKSTCVFGF